MRVAIALLIVLLPSFAVARPKTDTIVLVNGNTISGEILALSRSYLSISTDSMGTVNVKWPDVVRVASQYGYVVEDSQGNRYYGPLSSDADRTLNIAGARGAQSISMPSIVSIYPSHRTIWNRFDGSLDAGYSYTKSSSRSEFNLSGVIRYRSIRWEEQLAVDSLISTSSGSTDTDRDTATISGLRHLGSRWHFFSLAQYQHNLELGLSSRYTFLGGIARRLIQTNRTILTVMGGAGYVAENYTDTSTLNNAEAGLGADYQVFKLYSPKLDVSIQYLLFPSLTTSGRIRSEFQTKSKIELFKDFFWSLSFYDSYDSKPPGTQEQNHDYGVTTGVGWTFG